MFSLFPSRTVALEIFGFAIHWYGLMYLLAFAVAWFLVPRLQRYRGLSLSSDDWSSIVSWAILGVIAGGRLGFVLFYEPLFYLSHPLRIFAVWEGGMSSHGGFIGVAVVLGFLLYRRRIDMLKVADIVAIPTVLGLGIGRIGNFINQELYGTVTTLPWGTAVGGVEGLRHPVAFYEFFLCALIALACFFHLRQKAAHGRTLSLFLVLYGLERFFVEFLRAHDESPIIGGLALEQWLTIPLILVGIGMWVWAGKRRMTK